MPNCSPAQLNSTTSERNFEVTDVFPPHQPDPAGGQGSDSSLPQPSAAFAVHTNASNAFASADPAPREAMLALRTEVGKVVVGQEGTLSGLIAALLVKGHVLLEGVPGVAKTLLVKTLATALDLEFKRVQFTPDLMPSDVTGQTILDPADGSFRFREGPVFTNLLLADEINRTPPKTQASLLEAMEERQVSVEGQRRPLPDPFLVIATQNPVEYEGTYPLPEAQVDRFMFKLLVGYPTGEQEFEMLARHNRGMNPHDIAGAGVRPVANAALLAAAREQVELVTVEPVMLQYIVALCRATRETPSVQLGVSPRGAASLLHAAKAWAWLSGRPFLTADEVKAIAKPVLRHRILVRPELELEGTTADGVLDSLLAAVPAPR
ncbi:MAG TPA: AAA family ATPase [Acidimicrobiaceae bacterium]|nr:AAA family ATPase [Acidimicrobiaceae bacterium]